MFKFIEKYIDKKINERYSKKIQNKVERCSKMYNEQLEIAINRKYQELINKGVREIFDNYGADKYGFGSSEYKLKNAFREAIYDVFRKEIKNIHQRHETIDELKSDIHHTVDIMIKNSVSDEEFLDNIIQRIKNKQL